MVTTLLSMISPFLEVSTTRYAPRRRFSASSTLGFFDRGSIGVLGLGLTVVPPQLERAGEREQERGSNHQEGVGEGRGAECVQGIQSLCPSLSSRRQEGPDDRGSGPAAEEEERLVDPQAHPGLLAPERGGSGVGGGGVDEGETHAQAEHARGNYDRRGAGPKGREKKYGEEHDQESREDGGPEPDAVGEAPRERCEDG